MAGNREESRISAANYTSSSLFWSFSHKLDLFSSGRTFKKMLHSAAIGRFWKKEDATRVTSIQQLWATGCPAGEAIWLACFECEERRVCPIQFQNHVWKGLRSRIIITCCNKNHSPLVWLCFIPLNEQRQAASVLVTFSGSKCPQTAHI